MRTLLLAAAAALAFASAAGAVPPRQGPGHTLQPVCRTVMCAGRCLPRGVTCHKLPPNCAAGQWPCNNTCIPNGQACHR